MSAKTSFKTSPVSVALRADGLLPLPRLWVTEEDMEMIVYMANKHRDRVNRIRARVHAEHPELGDQRPPFHKSRLAEVDFADLEERVLAQAATDKEAAWEAYERSRARN